MKKILFLLTAFLILALVSGCEQTVDDDSTDEPVNAYACEQDSDCVVKDVRNCCGYYPRCVNVDHEPDIAAVQAECAEKGLVSVCGFPEIDSCSCIANRCESLQGGNVV